MSKSTPIASGTPSSRSTATTVPSPSVTFGAVRLHEHHDVVAGTAKLGTHRLGLHPEHQHPAPGAPDNQASMRPVAVSAPGLGS